MSALSLGLLLIFSGSCALIIRIFFFVDIKEVDKKNLEKVKLNSFALIAIAVLNLSLGVGLIYAFRNYYNNPLNTLINDFYKSKFYTGLAVIVLGIVIFIFRDIVFRDTEKLDGYKKIVKSGNERKAAILFSIILLLVGFIFLLI